MGQLIALTIPKTYVFEGGWGVAVVPIWQGDEDEPERISDIDVEVVLIAESAVEIIGEAPCIRIPGWGSMFVPVENFEHAADLTTDDTHDLRSRWFETETEAREHAAYTVKRWNHPSPWESFVQT